MPPRLRFGRLRLAAGIVVFAIGLGLAALAQSETRRTARNAARFPAPGLMADIGGRRLHYLCSGEGSPTVIFENSSFGSATSFDAVRNIVSRHTRACAYDRTGMGWSDPGPSVLSAGMLADDLHRLLDQAGVPPPYILVPASVGGLTAELFARRYPEEVAGLVFVDAGHSGALELVGAIPGGLEFQDWVRRVTCLAPTAERFGLIEWLDPLHLRRQPGAGAERSRALIYRRAPLATLCAMQRGRATTVEAFRAAPELRPDLPLVVLTHDTPAQLLPPIVPIHPVKFEPLWQFMQQRLARRSSRGTWQVVPGSGHLIFSSHPQVVADAILSMLSGLRGQARTP